MSRTAADIRRAFLGFFAQRGHTVVPSAPLVPHNDPTLLFTNSGMVPFKDVFTGKETRAYVRAASAQKCVRAGGKHNDLDNVGYTARHHTFFEMLGNFSFGDYFKEEAIAYAWALVTREFGLPVDRLLVTVHASDEDAAALWRKVAGLPDDRIIRIATDDNFWRMGDTGPCGPSSEIFFDQGPALAGGPPGSPDEDGDRFLEIWNLVFMQFEERADGTRTDLPRPCVDTGMGLERVAAVVQGVHSNYDCDLLRTLVGSVADKTHGPIGPSHRVIADHLRTSAFLIADGVLPGNEGRGYVLRRFMRRAMRHAHMLGAQEPLLHRLFPTLEGLMGAAYPELTRARPLILETLRGEEERFGRTLERGLALLGEATAGLRPGGVLDGAVAFRLYDTFGFPLDLTQDALRAHGCAVDIAGFEEAMAQQKSASRAAWAGSGEAATDKIWFDILEGCGPTDFLGYEAQHAQGKVLALLRDGAQVQHLEAGEAGAVITDVTPFYAESGGQVGDSGQASWPGGRAEVTHTTKPLPGLHAHHVQVRAGALAVGDAVDLAVDAARRTAIRANHSATHLLHAALRSIVGAHVTQKGSLVDADRLRFDIAHSAALTPQQAAEVEALVNAQIRANTPVTTEVMSQEDALKAGAMALFGEKYDDRVRVLTMGADRFSVELCGGTHVARTGDIGCLVITGDSALAAGVRRIEALTGAKALEHLHARAAKGKEAAALLKASLDDLPARVAALLAERKAAQQKLSALQQKLAAGPDTTAPPVKEVAGVKVIGRILDGVPAKDLKAMADVAKRHMGSGVVALVSVMDGKASLVVGVTEDLAARVSAVDLVRAGVAVLGGKGGGGRADMAQGGGPNAGAAKQALDAVEWALGGAA
jgi:alanyl-tRNA synthetase